MPTIDTSTIEGFEAMTTEEKLNAVLGLEIPEKIDPAKTVSKELFDKKASESAGWKRKHDELLALLTDEQKKKQAENEEKAALQDRVAALEREKQIADATAQYVSLGYSKVLAEETANAFVSGDTAKVFENAAKHRSELEQSIRSDLLKGTKRPEGSLGGDGGDQIVEAAVRRSKAKAEADAKAAKARSYYIIK